MRTLEWYQNKVISCVSLITAVVSILGLALSIMWNIRITNEIAEKVKQIEDNQIEQLKINTRLLTIIELK